MIWIHSFSFNIIIMLQVKFLTDASSRMWGGHYATSRKVAGSIPDEVIGFFNWHTSSRAMALGSTHRLTEMSTRNLPWDKGRPRLLTTLWVFTACYRDGLTFLPRYSTRQTGEKHDYFTPDSRFRDWDYKRLPLDCISSYPDNIMGAYFEKRRIAACRRNGFVDAVPTWSVASYSGVRTYITKHLQTKSSGRHQEWR
jgi:hypothetical protein